MDVDVPGKASLKTVCKYSTAVSRKMSAMRVLASSFEMVVACAVTLDDVDAAGAPVIVMENCIVVAARCGSSGVRLPSPACRGAAR